MQLAGNNNILKLTPALKAALSSPVPKNVVKMEPDGLQGEGSSRGGDYC